MKIFVINLKRDTDRLNKILQQFKYFNITNFEIFEGVDGKNLTYDNLKNYDSKTSKRIIRELSLSEIGCALSHIEVYRRIINENKRCLIIEDDVVLSDEFKNFIDIEIEDECDILFFGAQTTNVENENLPKTYDFKDIRYSKKRNGCVTRCYLNETYTTHSNINFYDIDDKTTSIDFLYGTYAYSPSIYACHKLIKLNYPVKMAADFPWNIHKFSLKIPKKNIIDVNYNIESNIFSDIQKMTDLGLSNILKRRILNKMYNK
jgi:GR25 family glycosyltransferase involved in LPS biosynthesis